MERTEHESDWDDNDYWRKNYGDKEKKETQGVWEKNEEEDLE